MGVIRAKKPLLVLSILDSLARPENLVNSATTMFAPKKKNASRTHFSSPWTRAASHVNKQARADFFVLRDFLSQNRDLDSHSKETVIRKVQKTYVTDDPMMRRGSNGNTNTNKKPNPPAKCPANTSAELFCTGK